MIFDIHGLDFYLAGHASFFVMSAGSEEGGAQGVPLGAVCGRSGFTGGEKYYIITYCQERRKWGMPKNILKKVKKVFDRGGGRVHKRFSPLLNGGGRFFDK